MAKRKILSCALATLLGLSTVFGNIPIAPSYLTEEAVAAIKETTTVSNEQEVVAEGTQVDSGNYGLCEYTKDGAILHAFCWSFNTIKQNMEDIAAAGYSTVQTSPINECLAGEGGGMQLFGNGKWYYHYQPTDWVIGNYQLGTREEYKAMCEEAEKYGIKIISDVLPNHTTPTLDAVSNNLANAAGGKSAGALYHSNGFNEIQNYGDRYECTLGQMGGLPDVNTENQGFQEYYLKFCNDVIACGGDGFRYDTAKHIGVHSDPKDASNTRGENDFWDVATGKKAVNGVSLNRPDNFFIYGEVLQDNGIPYDEYASYMNMTASSYGYNLRSALGNYSLSTGSISDWAHATPDKIVTWVESHDTYCNEHESAWMNDWQLRAGWAVIAARGNGTPLFFSRPDGSNGSSGNYWGNNLIGAKGNDQFKHPEVAACNHFRNAMVGESEYLSNPNGNSSVLVIERGTKGAVIINMGSDVSNIHMNKMADGTYLEEVSGQQVQVSGGTLNYTVPGGTIAVVYSGTTITKNPTVSVSKDSGTFNAPFELTLTPSNADNATYSINGGDEVSFTKATKVTIGEGCEIGDKVTVKVTATGEGEPFSKTYTYTMAETPEYKMYLRAKKSDFASAPTLYLYDSADKALNGAWPGNSMTTDGEYYIFTSDSFDSATAILVCGDWRSTADMEPGLSVSGYMEYDKSTNKFSTFTLNTTTKTPAPIQTEEPIKTDPPAPTKTPNGGGGTEPDPTSGTVNITVNKIDGTSFTTEYMDIKITLTGATSGTYCVDNGPEKTFKSGDTVSIGQGKIADTTVTLEVSAGTGTNTVTKTFEYNKVFDPETTVVKSSAISRIQSLFEVVANATEVNGAPGSSYYATNPNGNVGARKTITSASDFTEDMLIAQGVANDDPGTFRGTHEAPKFDPYSMYGAWDDENLYIGIQYTNVIDVVDPAQQAPQTGRGKPNGADADIPQMLVFDTRTGDYTDGTTNDTAQKTAWDTNVKFGGDAKVDKVFLYSPKDGIVNQAFFPVTNGVVDYDNVVKSGYNMPPIPGVETIWEDGFFGSSMYGIKGTGYTGYTPADLESDSGDWVDFLSEGHSKEHDTFCIVKLPLSLLGVTASDIESNGIGVMAIATYGSSGIGSLPADMTMLDVAGEAYSKDDSTSQEKEDEDLVTVGLAQLGKSSGVTTPTTKKPVETETPASETPQKTSKPTESTKYTVNFGADYSSPQYDNRKLTLKAIPYNGEGDCTYEFSVDGEIVQENSSKATYSWNGEAGSHTIKVVLEDESGKKISCEKQYVIEAVSGGNTEETEAPEETTKPTGSNNPIKTKEPEETETPNKTNAPNKTNPPSTTNTPTETVKPNNTQPPNGSQNNNENTGNNNDEIKIGLAVNSSTKSPQKAGASVIFAISIQAGGVAPYYYRLTTEDSQGGIKTLYAKNLTKTTNVKWIPTKAGTYKIHAAVTDGNGNYDVKTITYKVTNPIKVSTFKANKKSVKKGKNVKFTFKATSIGKVQYRIKVQKVGSKKITIIGKYSTAKTKTWKTTSKGKYYVYLQIKDAKGNTTTQKLIKTISVK